MSSSIISSDKAPHFYPRGWFVICASQNLAVAEVKPLKYFGKDWVLFRGQDGTAVLLDAYCPHLGAHLGIGGIVVDNSIQCPFHAWRFGAQGQCVDIPYAKHKPAKAFTQSYPLCERNGVIFMWHDSDGGTPEYDVPQLTEYGHAEWQPWTIEGIDIKTQSREVMENVADVAHFKYVHNMGEVTYFENIYTDTTATQIMRGQGDLGTMQSDATYYGPGFQITEMTAVFESRLLNANTPIDENSIHLWFGVMLKKQEIQEDIRSLLSQVYEYEFPSTMDSQAAQIIANVYCDRIRQGYYEDVQIWEHKVWRDAPNLCDGDGPLTKLRKWYAQFHLPKAA